MKKYNVKTPAQLKNKLHEKCEVKDCHGLKGRINRYCTWNYCICENELLINTNDTKSDSDSDDTSSSDSSDLCVELSID